MAHIHELIDFTVGIFIVHKDKVLLRFHDKYHFWGVPGGHVELDETPDKAAIREAKEESGLEIKLYDRTNETFTDTERFQKVISLMFMNIHRINETHRHSEFVYFATSDSNEVNPENEEDKSDKFEWADKDRLEEMDLMPDVKFYALEALNSLSSKE